MNSENLDRALILAPDGALAQRQQVVFTPEEARLMREYKKLLQRHQLLEATYCAKCFEGNREDGCRAYVTADQILIECRCKVRLFQGHTF